MNHCSILSNFYKKFICKKIILGLTFYRSSASISEIIEDHRVKVLPLSDESRTRLLIRRKHVFQDALQKARHGLDLSKHIQITFVGEPAVDAGGPLREFFHLLLISIAQNNKLFCGPSTARTPNHNSIEMQKQTFYYVGMFFALSIIHGGPAPMFLSSAVADYIAFGVQNVKASIADVPDPDVKLSLEKVFVLPVHAMLK